MGKHIRRQLTRGEEVILRARLDPVKLIAAWITGILFFWVFLIPTARAVLCSIRYGHSCLVLTDRRVFGRFGCTALSEYDIPLDKIDSVEIIRSFGGRVFGFGTVILHTVGGCCYEMHTVSNAAKFRDDTLETAAFFREYAEDNEVSGAGQLPPAPTENIVITRHPTGESAPSPATCTDVMPEVPVERVQAVNVPETAEIMTPPGWERDCDGVVRETTDDAGENPVDASGNSADTVCVRGQDEPPEVQ